MEQRIGPITTPVHAAGTDPTYIPGLTLPRPAEPEEAAADEAAEEVAEQLSEDGDAAEETAGAGVEDSEDEDSGDAASEDADSDDEQPDDDASDAEADDAAFAVADHRSKITADGNGIKFRLDTEKVEFDWDEIGAVEVDTPRFTRRFTVTVYTTGRRWYQADVDAPSRSTRKAWAADFDAVLDTHFTDSDEEAEEKPVEETEPAEETETTAKEKREQKAGEDPPEK